MLFVYNLSFSLGVFMESSSVVDLDYSWSRFVPVVRGHLSEFPGNKYIVSCIAFDLPYRISYPSMSYGIPLPSYVRSFISGRPCVVLPSLCGERIVSLTFRSLLEKEFCHTRMLLPYGFCVSGKPYSAPWLIVESGLDSDILRKFYPYTTATGLSIPLDLEGILFGTSSHVVIGFDNDRRGLWQYHRLRNKFPSLTSRLEVPSGYKDFSDFSELYFTEPFEFERILSFISLSIRGHGSLGKYSLL